MLIIVSYLLILGKSNDTTIFKNSIIYKKLLDGTLNIPDPKPLSLLRPKCMPFVKVGDEASSLSENIMRPYCGKKLTETKRIFRNSSELWQINGGFFTDHLMLT